MTKEKAEKSSEKKEGKEAKEVKAKEFSIDDLAVFCKRKGFVYPSGELYGGLAGFWDFGHIGVELKNNIKKEWWKYHVHNREDMEGIDGAIITNPKVWEASGHVSSFVDLAVQCKKCKNKTKIDKHEFGKVKCDKCGGEFENKGEFNPMFTTQVGPVKDDSIKSYLRPETAQLIFANFRNVFENARMKLPCGIAQVGKAFRNEISPREFIFRNREFEQMEIEYFIASGMKCPYMDEIGGVELVLYTEEMQKAGKEPKKMKIIDAWKKGIIKNDWHAYWMANEYSWFVLLGADGDKFRARQHTSEERSHYAVDTWDLEFKFPMGWRELQGFANRGNFDLTQHEKHSMKALSVVDVERGRVLPEVVCEPSLGVERAFLVFMLSAYEEDKKRENVVLHLSPKLAPYKAAVFPLMSKGEMYDMAYELFKSLKEECNVFFDKSGSIGRRYSRQDECGTPFCITVDDDSVKKKTVTLRDRDSTKQIVVKIEDLKDVLRKLVSEQIAFEDAGKLIETRVK